MHKIAYFIEVCKFCDIGRFVNEKFVGLLFCNVFVVKVRCYFLETCKFHFDCGFYDFDVLALEYGAFYLNYRFYDVTDSLDLLVRGKH